jgi:hypothetical protein
MHGLTCKVTCSADTSAVRWRQQPLPFGACGNRRPGSLIMNGTRALPGQTDQVTLYLFPFVA